MNAFRDRLYPCAGAAASGDRLLQWSISRRGDESFGFGEGEHIELRVDEHAIQHCRGLAATCPVQEIEGTSAMKYAMLPGPSATRANSLRVRRAQHIRAFRGWHVEFQGVRSQLPPRAVSLAATTRCRVVASRPGSLSLSDTSPTGAPPRRALNPDVFALGPARLARCSRPELKTKRSGNLFGCAFQCALANPLTPKFGGNDDAALPRRREHVRDIANSAVDGRVWRFLRLAGGGEASARKDRSPTVHRPGTWRVPGRADAAVGTCRRVPDGFASASLHFFSHLLPPCASSVAGVAEISRDAARARDDGFQLRRLPNSLIPAAAAAAGLPSRDVSCRSMRARAGP